jgi:competence protein ComGF
MDIINSTNFIPVLITIIALLGGATFTILNTQISKILKHVDESKDSYNNISLTLAKMEAEITIIRKDTDYTRETVAKVARDLHDLDLRVRDLETKRLG